MWSYDPIESMGSMFETDNLKPNTSKGVAVGDLVLIYTRHNNPTMVDRSKSDNEVVLRVLAKRNQYDQNEYLLLVTGADDHAVTPRIKIDKKTAELYGVTENKFIGCEAITVTDFHIVRIVKQDSVGACCSVCNEHNNYADKLNPQSGKPYMCFPCKEKQY